MTDRLLKRAETVLKDLSWIEWDRFIEYEYDDGTPAIDVYGWIERDGDDYKDFVLVTFCPDTKEHITSSPWADRQLNKELHGDLPDSGIDCQRVEEHFDGVNAVRLEADSA